MRHVAAGTDPLDMEATLTSPSGKVDSCEIRDLDEENLCQINFTPSEEGIHTISLKFKGIHFAGKPLYKCSLSVKKTTVHSVFYSDNNGIMRSIVVYLRLTVRRRIRKIVDSF